MAKGRFIVLEGPDGCGKSTQAGILRERLLGAGREVEVVRDPGGTPIGEAIREILLNPEYEKMSVRTELLLYMASRAQLLSERIEPALEAGRVVLSDRYLTSTIVYQGLAGGLGVEQINRVYEASCGMTRPDLVVILDVPLEVGRGRLDRGLDRMEGKGSEFHEKVRRGYLAAADSSPEKHVVIDATGSVESVSEAVWKVVEHVL